MYLDESPPNAFQVGEYNMVKSIITEEKLRIEEKFKPEREVLNYVNLFVGTNHSTTQFPFIQSTGSHHAEKGRRLMLFDVIGELAGAKDDFAMDCVDELLKVPLCSIAKILYCDVNLHGFRPEDSKETGVCV
jgi:hypothetical protein